MHEDFNVGDLFSVLRRRRRQIVAITVLGTLLIAGLPALMAAKYTAKGQILVEPQSLISDRNSVVERSPDDAVVQTQIAALTSPALLQRAIDNLKEDPAYRAAAADEDGQTDLVGSIWRAALVNLPFPAAQKLLSNNPLDLRALQRMLRVFQESDSHVVSVSVTSRSPQIASIIANRITDLFVQSEDQQKRASTERALAWVAERLPVLAEQVQRTSAAVQTYRTEYKLAGNDPATVTSQEIEALNRELVVAETEQAEITARLGLVRDLQRQNAGTDRLLAHLDSPRLRELTTRASALQQILAVQRATYLAGSQVSYKQEAELSEVRRQLQSEITRTIAAMDEQQATATARIQSLKTRLTAIANDDRKVTLSNLERQAAVSRELYDSTLRRREELTEQRQSLSPGVRIISAALIPEHPSSINPVLFVPPALVLSLLAGIGGAFGRERLDRTLRSEEDVRAAFDVECIGLVPLLPRLRGKRVFQYLLGRPFTQYAEAIRSVATGLLPSIQAGPRTILVTSSTPAEGKTVFSVSLATYLASIGRSTILLDFDLRSSSVADELNGDSSFGIADVLLNDCPIDDVIQRVPGLPLDYVAGAWHGPADPVSLLTAQRLKRLLDVLQQRYQVIIIDSAPILAAAESRMLPAIADQTLFVIEWGRMRREIVRNALRLVRNSVSYAVCAASVRAVITKVELKKHAQYRYGDSGECLAEFRRYVSRSEAASRRRIGSPNATRYQLTDGSNHYAR
jgi:uncharacterized protein involved in exopolysaccharide biosynthesis/Mrp family chromosome partitioning ATPase